MPPIHVNLQDVAGNSLVSRRQATIVWDPVSGMHLITNHGRNGTTVGQEKLGANQSTHLTDGSIIRVGKIGLRYTIQRADGSWPAHEPFIVELPLLVIPSKM